MEPFFQDGVIAQAANEVAQQGVAYFSSAGNRGSDSWEGPFVGSGQMDAKGCEYHDFGNGEISQSLTVAPGGRFSVTLQWDEPYESVSGSPGSRSDLDIRLLTAGTDFVRGEGTSMNVGGDPVEFVASGTSTTRPTSLDLRISYCGGERVPSFMKWVTMQGTLLQSNPLADAPTLYGHPNMPFTAGVGAAFELQTFGRASPEVESFSSRGGIPILFDAAGNSILEERQQPLFSGTDG